MSNNISFTGRVGKDPELKQVGQNDILEFSVVNNVGWGDRKVSMWFKCAIWGKQGVSLQPHITKGQEVTIHGELTIREYTNRDGVAKTSNDIRVNSIDLVGGKKEGGESRPAPAQNKPATAQSSPETDDDLPF